MKPFHLLLFQLFLAGLSLQKIKAQPNSVALIPPSGPSVNYASITSAYGAIPSSLPSGNNYLIELLPAYNGTDATEIYPILLTSKNLPPGGSTITIRPAAGNIAETIKRPAPVVGNLMEIRGGTNIILDGRPGGINSAPADYLNMVDTYSGTSNINLRLSTGASYNIIQYINFTAALGANSGAGNVIVIINPSPAGFPNNNNVISNNILTGGEFGILVRGTVEYNTGNTISNNAIKDFASYGIFEDIMQNNTTVQNNTITFSGISNRMNIIGIYNQGGLTISNISDNIISANLPGSSIIDYMVGIQNTGSGSANISNNLVTNLTSPVATTIHGILTSAPGTLNITNNTISNLYSPVVTSMVGIASAGGILTISKNKISGLKSDAAVNMEAIQVFASGNSTSNINNNFISITDANPNAITIYGITTYQSGATSHYTSNIFFNSIRIGGTQVGGTAGEKRAACIYKLDNYSGSIYNQKNNICIMERSGGTPGIILAGFITENISGAPDIDYNIYYGSGAVNSYACYWLTTPYSNAQQSAYRAATAPYEQNSTFSTVNFQSNTDLHLAGSSLLDPLLNGTPIAGITLDIDGDIRKTYIPTRGADENQIPVPITNTRSGNWSDPTIWSNNSIPQATDDVLLLFDVIVDINAICRSLNSHGHGVNVNPSLTLTIVH
jgi:hypothetical protein